jgi:hypothetical protein
VYLRLQTNTLWIRNTNVFSTATWLHEHPPNLRYTYIAVFLSTSFFFLFFTSRFKSSEMLLLQLNSFSILFCFFLYSCVLAFCNVIVPLGFEVTGIKTISSTIWDTSHNVCLFPAQNIYNPRAVQPMNYTANSDDSLSSTKSNVVLSTLVYFLSRTTQTVTLHRSIGSSVYKSRLIWTIQPIQWMDFKRWHLERNFTHHCTTKVKLTFYTRFQVSTYLKKHKILKKEF